MGSWDELVQAIKQKKEALDRDAKAAESAAEDAGSTAVATLEAANRLNRTSTEAQTKAGQVKESLEKAKDAASEAADYADDEANFLLGTGLEAVMDDERRVELTRDESGQKLTFHIPTGQEGEKGEPGIAGHEGISFRFDPEEAALYIEFEEG